MNSDRFSLVFRILDHETRLLERADQKAISLLSILGVFMVFFIVYYRLVPVNTFTVVVVTIYFALALTSIWNLIMVVRPRVEKTAGAEEGSEGKDPQPDPTFFQGICRYPSATAYRESLEAIGRDEDATLDVYTRQIYTLARINAAKYKYIQRGVILVIGALVAELVLICYLFAQYLGTGWMPSLG
jgi:hypothetical protein